MKGINVRNLMRTEILSITSLIVSIIFFLFSVGLLIGNGANIIVPYMALFTAIALSGLALVVGVVSTRKPILLQIENKPGVPLVQSAYLKVPVEKSITSAKPIKNEPIIQKVENNYREQKIEPMNALITLPQNKKQEATIAKPASETKSENQKVIKPIEKTPLKTNAVKSTAGKKAPAKRSKAKGKKRK
jgi:hypothetical protein